MNDWEFVKNRTATVAGAVWRSADGALYKRTGGDQLRDEVEFQRVAAGRGYPIPEIMASGSRDGTYFSIERSLGEATLHERALEDARNDGRVSRWVIDNATSVSTRLMLAQARDPQAHSSTWFERAAFAANVFNENPDFDTPRTRELIKLAIGRMDRIPHCLGHLDYGLPNILEAGVIDWQHHGTIPLGYDVYPALDIVAFKGGGRGYDLGVDQRGAYLAALDKISTDIAGRPLSEHLGDFLFVKCFFFLALMRPTDPKRYDKDLKWRYRRDLFTMGLDQYESSGTVDTSSFRTLEQFASEHR